jgi:C4-dicarboxylate transporter DctM subunit
VANAIVNSGLGEYGVLALLILLLITVGMFLDGVSIFLIFVPLLCPSCSSTSGTRSGSA